MNLIIYPSLRCPECYSAKLITDTEKEEVYCSNCGLVVKDNSFTPLTLQEKLVKRKLTAETGKTT